MKQTNPSWNKNLSLQVKIPEGTIDEIISYVQSLNVNIHLFVSSDFGQEA